MLNCFKNKVKDYYYTRFVSTNVVISAICSLLILVYICGVYHYFLSGVFDSKDDLLCKFFEIVMLVAFSIHILLSIISIIFIVFKKSYINNFLLFLSLICLLIMNISLSIVDCYYKFYEYKETYVEIINLYGLPFLYFLIYINAAAILFMFAYEFYLETSAINIASKKKKVFVLTFILTFIGNLIFAVPNMLIAKEHYFDFNRNCFISSLPTINIMFLIALFSIILLFGTFFKKIKSKKWYFICSIFVLSIVMVLSFVNDMRYHSYSSSLPEYDLFSFIYMIAATYFGLLVAPLFPYSLSIYLKKHEAIS